MSKEKLRDGARRNVTESRAAGSVIPASQWAEDGAMANQAGSGAKVGQAGCNRPASPSSAGGKAPGDAEECRPEQPAAYPQVGFAHTCRSYEEYLSMFALSEQEITEGPFLDIAGGASSFTAQLHARGLPAVATDPLYASEPEQVIAAAHREIDVSTAKLAAAADSYDWSYYGSIRQHRQMREASLERFAADFTRPDARSRYIAASLPDLPFADGTFALVLCSHFLFLYGDQLDEAFHRRALAEMLRVTRPGGQVRVYPLVTLQWRTPPYLSLLLAELEKQAQVRMIDTRLPFTPVKSPVLQLDKFA